MNPTRSQPFGLAGSEDARRHRNVEAGLRVNARHQVKDPGERSLVGTANSEHDAELGRSERSRLGGCGQHLVGVQERCRLHGGLVARRLGAEVAVLRAAPRLRGQDPLDLDGRSAPGQANVVGQRGKCMNGFVAHGRERGQLLRTQPAPVHDQGIAGSREDGAGGGHGAAS